jgi:two-component system response regulator GlrR
LQLVLSYVCLLRAATVQFVFLDDIAPSNPSLPILLTAHGTIPDAVEATGARGVFTHLTKLFDGKALLEKHQRRWRSAHPPAAPARQPEAWHIISRSSRMV